MARGINKVILIGNCGTDPDIRQLSNGKAVVNVSLATSESWRDKNSGEQQSKTAWHRLVFYSPLAEIAHKYINKGTQLYIEGSLNYGQYEKDGITRYTTDIIVRNMELLGSRSNNLETENNFTKNSISEQSSNVNSASAIDDDDDIPF